jgi:hypothetical protein
MSDKQPLLLNLVASPHREGRSQKLLRFLYLAVLSAPIFIVLYRLTTGLWEAARLAHFDNDGEYDYLCPQAGELVPNKHADVWKDLVNGKLTTEEFKSQAIEWLSGAVQIP